MNDTTESSGNATKSPTHIAYRVRNRDGQKGVFTRVRTRMARASISDSTHFPSMASFASASQPRKKTNRPFTGAGREARPAITQPRGLI
jgi:hypothetical protein